MRARGIAFEERLTPFGEGSNWDAFRTFSPSGKVPCLVDGDVAVWDSLAIVEYLAERHTGVWPQDMKARAWARCAAAEMHSGFAALRTDCSMTVGQRVHLHAMSAALQQDVARIDELWNEGLRRFGGPYLAGAEVTAVDAFFAPVAFRVQTYSLPLGERAAAYAAGVLALPAMREWADGAIDESWRESSHEAHIRAVGEVIEDRRRKPD